MLNRKIVEFYTLGCKLNFSESSTLARQFMEGGAYRRKEQGEIADICVINSCSVTEGADKKGRNLIRKVVRENPGAMVVVTGCYAQLKPEEISAIDGVDIVLGNGNKSELYERVVALQRQWQIEGTRSAVTQVFSCESHEIANFFSAFSSGDRTRSFLKIQDGCDYKCSYCTIPYARGGSRSMSIAEVVDSAKQVVQSGSKEIVLTGINTGDFGRKSGEQFSDLLCELDRIEGVERYRISSIEPNLLTDQVIEITKNSAKFQPHFHIPLQSGSDEILSLMKRRYNTTIFRERIEAVRRAMPSVFLGIDVIVGFPGESESHFEDCYQFLSELSPAFLHIFPYSERPGTVAVEFPHKVASHDITQRVRRLSELSDRLHREFYERHVGERAKVLFERTKREGKMTGYSENYIKIVTPLDRTLINTTREVRMIEIDQGGNMVVDVI